METTNSIHPGTMAPVDRFLTLLHGQKVDRVPLYHFMLGFCAKNVGLPISIMYTDPAKSYQAQRWTFEQYGIDGGPDFGYASYGGWEFGGKINFPATEWEQAPSHGSFAVTTEEDISRLKLPDIKKDGMLPAAMAFSRLQEQNKTPITIVMGGCFTIAGNITPVEQLCRWMLKKPALVHRLLRLATDHILEVVRYWAETFGAKRVLPNFWEPLASNQIISPRQFESFVLPYLKEASEKILQMGIRNILYHVCGEQNLNLRYWAQVPMGDPGLVSVGHQVDLTTAIQHFGDKCIIIGNLDPSIIQNGTPGEVYDACRQCIEKGKLAPRGYMLMSGCELPPTSPPINVYMMQKAVRDFGRY
jgi:uroporphyrinogen decarboxylase